MTRLPLKPLVLLGLVGTLSACNSSNNTPSPPDASPTPTASPMPSPSTSPSPSPSVSPSPSPEPSPSVSPSPSPEPSSSPSPEPSPSPDPTPSPEPSPEPEGAFVPLTNDVAYRFDDKPPGNENLTLFALAYVQKPAGGSFLLTSYNAEDPESQDPNLRDQTAHAVHFNADGSRDGTRGVDGLESVCDGCAADHPFFDWAVSRGSRNTNEGVAALLDDGSVLVTLLSREVKGFEGFFPLHDVALLKVGNDGRIDETFGDRGILPITVGGAPFRNLISFADFTLSRFPDAEGHVLVGANTRMVRVSVDGVVDETFGDAGIQEVGSAIRRIVTDRDGVIYVRVGLSGGDLVIVPPGGTVSEEGLRFPEDTDADADHFTHVAHPDGGVLHVIRDSPALPMAIRHMDGEGNEVSRRVLNPRNSPSVSTSTEITVFRDVNFLVLDEDRILLTAAAAPNERTTGQSFTDDVGFVFGLYDAALMPLAQPYTEGCVTAMALLEGSDAPCAVLEEDLAFYRMPEGSLRFSGAVYTGFHLDRGPGFGFRYLLEEVGSWVFFNFPTP